MLVLTVCQSLVIGERTGTSALVRGGPAVTRRKGEALSKIAADSSPEQLFIALENSS